MELKIKIATPKGYAGSGKERFWETKLMKKLILGKGKMKEEYVNEDGTEWVWVVEVSARNYQGVCKNLYLYQGIVGGVLENKHARKALKRMADSPEDYDSLVDMVKNQTTIEIIKQATAEELVEANKTWWQRMKEKFRKTDAGNENKEKESLVPSSKAPDNKSQDDG